MTTSRIPHILLALAALASGLWVAADGRHHWDEPAYLYAGAWLPAAELTGGQVQPSGIPHFMQGRILHAVLVKGVMQAAGSPTAGFVAMLALNLVLLAASVFLLHRILRGLLPGVPWTGATTALVAMSPVVLYLAFRVLADVEAFFAALLATWALMRLARGSGLLHAAIATAALAVCALSKNQMAWMPATFWAAFVLVPVADLDRRRLLVLGAASGLAAIGITLATLEGSGVGIEAYWASYRGLADTGMPLVVKVLNVGTELGILWLLIPLALLTTRRRELAAFGLWLALAMAPFLFVINSIEARHVAVNLVAAGALFALALEALGSRWQAWHRGPGILAPGVALAGLAVIMATNAIVLAIMPHRVVIPEMREALDVLDARYGAGGYVLLTATGYPDFHLVRVLWPAVDVRDPGTAETYVHDGARSREQAIDAWYGGREIGSLDELRQLGKPVAWLGYRRTFAAENLHDMVARLSPALAARLSGSVTLPDRLFPPASEWLWGSADVAFEPLAEVGHYHVYALRIAGTDSGSPSP